MANLFLSLIAGYTSIARANFIRKTRQPLAVQEQFLQTLLQTHQHTELGQIYQLDKIATVDQFRDRIPVLPYASYEPYIQRIAAGEANVLTSDPVRYISISSGTTGKRKWIPITQRYQSTLQRSNLAGFGFAIQGLKARRLKFGKFLLTNCAQALGQTSAGIEYGLASSGSVRMERRLGAQLYAHPYDVLQITDSLTRHYLCLLFALRDTKMRGMVANFPMLLLRTCQYLEQYAEDLIHDMTTGTLPSWLQLQPEQRAQLEQQWSATPKRAAHLRSVLKSEGRLTPKLAWPELSSLATARGGTSDFYFQRFPDYFGDMPVFGGVYGCSEATYGIAHEFNDDGYILALESGFFEFVPADQDSSKYPQTLLPTEVKVGKHYRILVTNYAGLYRYDIGDVVEVLGFYNQTPMFTFRYRQGGLLSSTSEKTTEAHAVQVMQILQQQFHLSLEDFCITLSDQEIPAHYLVNIELATGQHLADPYAFLSSFDSHLQEVNRHYQVMRKDQIPPPRLRILAAGSFEQFRQQQLTQGTPDSQLKILHISEDRQCLKGLQIEREISFPN